MLIAFVLLLLLFLVCIRKKQPGENSLDYKTTQCIKGFLALLIVVSHMQQYHPFTFKYDSFASVAFGQMIVAPFFFFSGYGIYESTKKDVFYGKKFWLHRFLKTLCDFWFLLIPFLCLIPFEKTSYGWETILLSFTGLTSIGNSNWFVFVILLFYLFCSILFAWYFFLGLAGPMVLTLAVIAYFIVFKILGYSSYWVDTSLCFPLGIWFSFFKGKIGNRFSSLRARLLLPLIFTILLVLSVVGTTKLSGPFAFVCDVLQNLILCFLLWSFCLSFACESSVFFFLGKCSFSIYLLQRFPMIIFSEFVQIDNDFAFYFVCLSCAIFLGVIGTYLTDFIDRHSFEPMTAKFDAYLRMKANKNRSAGLPTH